MFSSFKVPLSMPAAMKVNAVFILKAFLQNTRYAFKLKSIIHKKAAKRM